MPSPKNPPALGDEDDEHTTASPPPAFGDDDDDKTEYSNPRKDLPFEPKGLDDEDKTTVDATVVDPGPPRGR